MTKTVTILALPLFTLLSSPLFASKPPVIEEPIAEIGLTKSVATVQIPFIAGDRQTAREVAYYASTFAGTVYVTRRGKIVYSLGGTEAKPSSIERRPTKRPRWTLTETLVGGKPRPQGDGVAPTHVSFFIGNDPKKWRPDVAAYDTVALGEVWPGIEVRLRALGHNTEKLFTVRPGAKASRIHIRVAGARSLRVDAAGALVASTGLGDVTLTAPIAYQEADGQRRAVGVAYLVNGSSYGFRLGKYDSALPVIIDPLLQATYLGGGGDDSANALEIDPASGDVYVVGQTASSDFPGTAGGPEPVNGGGQHAFVARLDSTLKALKQATYLGGRTSGASSAYAVRVAAGELYVAGQTDSRDFPGTTGGAQATNHGAYDAFVSRLNLNLTAISQSTYLGGKGFDVATSLLVNPASANVYVAGYTDSTDLPGTLFGAQEANHGAFDGFVARLNMALTTLVQSTYLGGSAADQVVGGLAVDPTSGDVYVAGLTLSADFPGTAGAAQSTYAGNDDAFVARLNATLTTLLGSTYLGGSETPGFPSSGVDVARHVALHPMTGEVYVTGATSSQDFPGTASGVQPKNHGFFNCFIARVNPTLTTIDQTTYLGGSYSDDCTSLVIDPTSGDVIVAGVANSTDFPGTAGGIQRANAGKSDGVIARLDAELRTLKQATYLGGEALDQLFGLDIHPSSGDVYVSGFTASTGFPGTFGGAQPTNQGGFDVFVARMTPDLSTRVEGEVINADVSFNPLQLSYVVTPPTADCPGGTFSFKARLTNTSSHSLSHLLVEVTTLTNGNFLQNADGGPGGPGAVLTIPRTGAYADGELAPGESVDVTFVICRHNGARFSFFVDVLGHAQ